MIISSLLANLSYFNSDNKESSLLVKEYYCLNPFVPCWYHDSQRPTSTATSPPSCNRSPWLPLNSKNSKVLTNMVQAHPLLRLAAATKEPSKQALINNIRDAHIMFFMRSYHDMVLPRTRDFIRGKAFISIKPHERWEYRPNCKSRRRKASASDGICAK